MITNAKKNVTELTIELSKKDIEKLLNGKRIIENVRRGTENDPITLYIYCSEPDRLPNEDD